MNKIILVLLYIFTTISNALGECKFLEHYNIYIKNKLILSVGYMPNKHCLIYDVPRRIMRLIMRRAAMLAGDRSQGVAEAKPRQSRDKAETNFINEWKKHMKNFRQEYKKYI